MKITVGILAVACFVSVPIAYAKDAKVENVGKAVDWETSDGVQIQGLYQPASDPAGLTWVLLHGLGSNKQEWLSFTQLLAAQGDGFLIYDARGHGSSLSRLDESSIHYKDFGRGGADSEWTKMVGDLDAAIRFLKSRFSLNPRRIGVGGASLGANVALVYASQHPEVPALVLLSPGLNYAGIESEAPLQRYGKRPVYLAASPGDTYAYSSVRRLSLQCGVARCLRGEGAGATHGVNMLNEPFTSNLLNWMKQAH